MTLDWRSLVARARSVPIEHVATFVAAALLALAILIALSAVVKVTARNLAAEHTRPMELQ